MAKYRWGFEIEGNFTECFPRVDNNTALEYSQETGNLFYRAKLSSNLDFRFEYDDILSAGYNAVHIVVLQSYNEATEQYEEIWRGKFTLTDCTINADTKTITVTPETIDNYTEVLAHVQDEYNMVKLKPKVQPIDIKIRPCLQLYSINDTKLTNYIGESYWEADCEAIGSRSDLTDTYHFSKISELFAFYVEFDYVLDNQQYRIKVIAVGNPSTWEYEDWNGVNRRVFYATGTITDSALIGSISLPITYTIYDNGDLAFGVHPPASQYAYKTRTLFVAEIGDAEIGQEMNIVIGTGYDAYDANAQLNYIYARCLLQTELAQISLLDTVLDTYDIPVNDMAGNVNFNYNKVCPITTECVHFDSSSNVQIDPTEWGMSYYKDRYFVRFLQSGYNPMPVGISGWKYASLWVYPYYRYRNYIDQYAATRTIKDTYPLAAVIKELFAKADREIRFELNDPEYSQFLFASDFPVVSNPFRLYVTPRSNIISSYYNSPAQNAPITLLQILDMLKNAFRVYWYIDKDKKLHFEHINYFENGMSYDESNTVLLDLDTVRHTRTLNSKAFGQNTYKYDKQDMPAQYQFEWDDTQTLPFAGVPMKAQDPYVMQGQKEDINMSKFDADIDYILSTPDDIAKDGFALIACRYDGQNPTYATQITKEITIRDEDNIAVDYIVQNADCAMALRETDMWRYFLPCENWLINNFNNTAKTTGNYKLQTVEFADLTMNDIITDVTNCIKKIRTQQGDGSIKTLSINLNSFASKADLLFNFVGRWYYLRGTALQGDMTITLNGETITISVGADNTFIVKYKDPISELSFAGTDVVSVNFADCDNLNDLISADNMFKNCAELIAVDFANKTFGAVTSATDMFAGAVQLQTLICPNTNSWKADLDFSDCQQLTAESLNELIVNFLYDYDSGTHTITPNTAMWNNLAADVQTDLLTKAQAKGWQIAIPAQYALSGTSGGSTVYVTINGTPMEIDVVGGTWQYDYNTPISSISFENDTDVVDVDFSLSDGLAAVTSLNDAFKGCVGLTTVDFSNCDLSNLVSATDCFAGCTALYELIVPQGTWKPDIDLSASVMPKTEMLNVINGLYDYTSGTHTITFNQTIWDAMSVADQQIVFDAADAKGWATNAVAVVYTIKGKSTAASETFNIQFIDDGSLTPSAAETITVNVDANGDWSFEYSGKKIYSLYRFAYQNNTVTSVNFDNADDFSSLTACSQMLNSCTALTSASFVNQTFANVQTGDLSFAGSQNLLSVNLHSATFENIASCNGLFYHCYSLQLVDLANATFAAATGMYNGMFDNCRQLQSVSMPNAIFGNLTTAHIMFRNCYLLQSVDLSAATFASCTNTRGMFVGCRELETITWSANLNFGNLVYMGDIGSSENGMFYDCRKLQNSAISAFATQTFASVTNAMNAFSECYALTKIDLHSATFANLSQAFAMFYNAYSVTEIDLSAATFANVSQTTVSTYHAFGKLNALTTLKVPTNSTAILPTSTAANAPFNIAQSPLTYASMLNIANWLSDLTGQTAHTCTFKTSAWNALSSAEQATIQGILSGKNWNLATA